MNFGGLGGGGIGGGGGVAGNAQAGSDLEEIQTDQISFQAVSGADVIRLLPARWPSNSLPPTTSSLLSVASKKELVAAASPEALVLAKTSAVRQAFLEGSATNKVKPFNPQATIPVPRCSQLVFSSDESCLVLAAEQGGGLAVYDVESLIGGKQAAAFELTTDGQGVRQLLPNPSPSPELSRFFGVVTDKGQLLLADLKERKLVQSSNGSFVFKENVSCACWSRLGKQIVAGLGDGSAVQIDQQGNIKAIIPEPPQLSGVKDPCAGAYPITSILWLETHDFLIVHTPINSPDSMGQDDSFYHLARRDKASSTWTFHKFQDPCPPFGADRKPAHHFLQRLREWPPSLSDVLLLSSTASTDIGVFSRSKAPLDPEHPVVDRYTFTQLPDDCRAAMPMGAEADTSPIGMAIDLSAKERIPRPIPTDEAMDQSPVELPALFVLSDEGTLSMWWIVYKDSVKQHIHYPDLLAAGGRSLSEKQAPAASTTAQPAALSSFRAATPVSSSPFGTASTQTGGSSFGASPTPAFGRVSGLGSKQSPWGATGPTEPGTENELKLEDIPEAEPIPTTQAIPPAQQESKVEDAPLPPDFITWKPKPGAKPAPIPPGFGESLNESAAIRKDRPDTKGEDAPPYPEGSKPASNGSETEQPLAGSSPLDLARENLPSSETTGPPEESDDEHLTPEADHGGDEEDDDEEKDDEGRHQSLFSEEEESELSEEEEEEEVTQDPVLVADQERSDLFRSRITSASPNRTSQSVETQEESTTPATNKKDSYTPAGLPKAPIIFSPPKRNMQQSPRSPSPVRNATSPQRLMSQAQSRVSRQPSRSASRTLQNQVSSQPQRIAVPPAELVDSQEQKPKASKQPTEPSAGQLEDEEDARVQALLAMPIEHTRDMPSFLAHQDYLSAPPQGQTKGGLGRQIERVFRDVNSMVDTFALNARNLSGFVEGNQPSGSDRGVEELEDEDSWTLGDASELQRIVRALEEQLKAGELKDVNKMLADAAEDEQELQRLRKRVCEGRKQMKVRTDSTERAAHAMSPLPADVAAQQRELRQSVQKVQTLLARGEERTTVLRAELASLPGQNGGIEGRQTPTVEAVTNTIQKMTAMIEKRSSEIDFLEAQIRGLGGPHALHQSDTAEKGLLGSSLRSSRHGSPALALSSRASMQRSRLSVSAWSSSRAGTAASPRKSLLDVSAEEVEAWRAKKEARRRVGDALRQYVSQRERPRVVQVQRS